MKFFKFTLIYISLILTTPAVSEAEPQCLGHSWLVEFHAKRRAVNCQSAHQEIYQVFESIQLALKSGRSVEVTEIGQFLVKSKNKSTSPKDNQNKLKKISFKPHSKLLASINNLD